MDRKWIAIALGLGACGSSAAETESPVAMNADEAAGDEAAHPCATDYVELHDCAGLNTCRGLGGCSVDAEKLAWLAECRGIPLAEAGDVHDCSGMNSCRGLGGCSVDAEKLARLRASIDG